MTSSTVCAGKIVDQSWIVLLGYVTCGRRIGKQNKGKNAE